MAGIDNGFLYSLISSASFYRTTVWWALLALVLLGIAMLVLVRLRPSRPVTDLMRDERGSSVAVDFVLTLPIFLTLLLLVVQFALMSHDALIVHYAAYSAARSARVWMWDGPSTRPWLRDISAHRRPAVLKNNSAEVQQRAETAARFALISAAPAKPGASHSSTGLPVTILSAMAQVGGLPGRDAVLIQKAQYAFDPSNTTVKIKQARAASNQPGLSSDAGQPGDAWAVTAQVQFRIPLDIPIAQRLLGIARGDGSYYETTTAQVTLL